MRNEQVLVAVIPARAGSKRIPDKNHKLFAGQPMIAYAINAALESRLFSQVVVSTESSKIASVAIDLGASVPFLRPDYLADDFTPTVPVIRNAIEQLPPYEKSSLLVCCIYPCVPFLEPKDLKSSFELLSKSGQRFCFPVAEYSSPIQRALSMDSEGNISPIFDNNDLTRTQEFPKSFYDAGQFYWGSAENWLSTEQIHQYSIGYEIESWRAIDIDTMSDWQRAEQLYQAITR